MILWAAFGEDWALNHKISFDGAARIITIAPSVAELDIKSDIYSSWKEWTQLRDNSKYLPAIRTIGGDPIGAGRYAGDLYFLQNGWQIEIDHPVKITGVLYHDDNISPYSILPGGAVSSEVSAIVQKVDFAGTVQTTVEPSILPEDIWNYLLVNANTPGSVGERFKSLLTVAKYLGLK